MNTVSMYMKQTPEEIRTTSVGPKVEDTVHQPGVLTRGNKELLEERQQFVETNVAKITRDEAGERRAVSTSLN